jgi:hypothetical protein
MGNVDTVWLVECDARNQTIDGEPALILFIDYASKDVMDENAKRNE